jgi:malate dehydrogenase (oxaloacetate-decarboxylating)(NADP+)
VLRAAQLAIDEGRARPILIGRPSVIEARIKKAGLHINLSKDADIVDPENDSRFRTYWEAYHKLMGRRGIPPEASKAMVRRSNTTIAALMVHLGDADAMLCGLVGRFDSHLKILDQLLGSQRGGPGFATLNALTLEKYTLFIADTNVHEDPSAETLARIAVMAADEVRRFGLPPKVAFLSHSNFGTSERASARKMRAARELFAKLAPDIECEGEMHGDAALSEEVRRNALPDSPLTGSANLLICPNLDAANILFNVLKMTGGNGVTVGPILLGATGSAHILTSSATVRRVLNMTALAVANANIQK